MCVFSYFVDCRDYEHCDKCGWNPSVSKERAAKLRVPYGLVKRDPIEPVIKKEFSRSRAIACKYHPDTIVCNCEDYFGCWSCGWTRGGDHHRRKEILKDYTYQMPVDDEYYITNKTPDFVQKDRDPWYDTLLGVSCWNWK